MAKKVVKKPKRRSQKRRTLERFLISGDVKGSSFLHLVVSLGRPFHADPNGPIFIFFCGKKMTDIGLSKYIKLSVESAGC